MLRIKFVGVEIGMLNLLVTLCFCEGAEAGALLLLFAFPKGKKFENIFYKFDKIWQ